MRMDRESKKKVSFFTVLFFFLSDNFYVTKYLTTTVVKLFFFCFFFFHLTYHSRWAPLLDILLLWSLRIFPSLPGSRLTNFHHDASSTLVQLVNQWLDFTYSRSHAFRDGRKNNKNPALTRIELTTSALLLMAGVNINHRASLFSATETPVNRVWNPFHLRGDAFFWGGKGYWER